MSENFAHLRRQSQQRTADAKARYTRWAAKHAGRLAGLHPDVATEVRSTVMDRFHAGTESGMTDKDLRQCKMRVASRLRVRRYGRCTDDEEAARQLREIAAALGAKMEDAA